MRRMLTIESKYKVNAMDKTNVPVAYAESGDTILFETKDCFATGIT